MTALIMPRSLRRSVVAPASTTSSRGAGRSTSDAAPAAVRLTRRGRLLLIGLPFVTGAAALLVVAAVFLLPATVKASTDGVGEPVTRSVTVQADQTLWEIASAVEPGRDTREVMSDIAQLNDLSSPSLTAGQVLEVPAR